MLRKCFLMCLMILVLGAGLAFAQTPVVDPGWEVFVIRLATASPYNPPVILDNDSVEIDAIEFQIPETGQKAGLATNLLNGAKVSQISTLHVDRLDALTSYGPYFNIWVTDGDPTHFAVLSNEPSDAEWAGSRWDVPNWDFLKTKRCKVYETTGASGGAPGTSWLAPYMPVSGNLTFEDVADLIIAPPSPAFIAAGNGIGSGAPDVLGTNVAYGYNWVFGDTQNNYVSDGFIVNNYSATATFSVQNVTQGTSYGTIEDALAVAVANDVITIDDGIYNPPSTLYVNVPLSITGASEAGVVINIPAAGGYGFSVASSNVTLEKFTLAAVAGNENYPIHASGTSNPTNGFDYLTIQNVTISGAHRRAGFDIHGYNHVLLSHLTSSDAWGGNGLQITGCVDVDVNNITTLDNAWGSIAIYCSSYLSRGSSDVRIDGDTLSLGEMNLFSQDEFGFLNTGIVVSGYEYQVRNMNYRPDAAGFTMFQDTFADASVLALGLEGVEVGSYILTIADGNATVIPGITIKAAIGGVESGKTIDVLPGLYTEAGQIVIDKDVSIVGDVGSRPIIMTDSSTGASGDSRGWFLQSAGTHLELLNLELDGSGFNVYQGIRSLGSGALGNCAFRSITYNESGPNYAGTLLAAFGAGNWNITGCTFDNIGRVGFLAFGSGLTNSSFTGNTYTGKGVGDWLDYACDISAGAVLTVQNNTITACQGVASVDGSTSAALLVSTHFAPGTTATINNNILTGNTTGVACGFNTDDTSIVVGRDNDLSGNDSFGVSNSAPNTVDFLSNWWGSASGPFHATLNPLGTGVAVEDNILFDPWSGMAGGGIIPVTTGPLNCSQTITLTFNYTADDYTPDMFLYNAVVSATSGLDFGAVVDLLPFGTINDNFFAMSSGTNEWTITGSTVGSPTYPVSGPGTTGLFTITFSADGDVIGDVVFDSLTLRDPDNNTIPVDLSGATITYDCTAPLAVTDINADPHHNRVGVSWTHDGDDVDHYEVFSGLWHDGSHGTVYPEYDDVANTVPARGNYAAIVANTDEWDDVGDASLTTLDQNWANANDRGVYYYEVFAVDAVGNASLPATANDRATNYWLGDMNADGAVDPTYDISVLAAAFGTSDDGVSPYNAFCDVGPTDDWSRVGIPTTDDDIDFEDLMVFTMNFGVVSNINKSEVVISSTADLSWVRYDEGTYALRLNDADGLKGVHLRAALPEGASFTVTAGSLLDQQSEMTFLQNIGEGLDVNLAITGVDNGFTGQGDLFMVESSVELTMDDIVIDLRGSDNSSIEVNLDSDSGTLTPRVFGLNAAYPNPFNPMTKISFSLPETQDVRLNVYGIDGKLVTTLVNETRGAGLHEVIWNGQNDAGQVQASGLYFYRIEAGPYSQVRKMTLMK